MSAFNISTGLLCMLCGKEATDACEEDESEDNSENSSCKPRPLAYNNDVRGKATKAKETKMADIEIGYEIDRAARGIKCPCGGYAERVSCTLDEIKKYDCGHNIECCSRAFVCGLCGNRLVGKAEAPR